jgi:hypothetical protein
VVLGVLLAIAVGSYALTTHHERPAKAPNESKTLHTATVTKGDLTQAQTLPGSLGFGAPKTLNGTGSGFVTKLPLAGDTTSLGKPLYSVDDKPVMVFFGETPVFRKLDQPGVRGNDVTMIANNLRAMGYDFTVPEPTRLNGQGQGDVFTASLKAALKRWQQNTGQQATGTLEPGSLVVMSGPSRVNTVMAELGDPADKPLLTYSSTVKSVTVPVDADSVAAIGKGQQTEILLPDGRKAIGKVTSVSSSVQGGSLQDNSAKVSPATVAVTVVPLHDEDVKGLDAASVQVRFTTTALMGVLQVPVTALIALKEGGYALQRVDGQLLAVTTGMFAGGQVEVKGAQLTAGMKVVTAS